MLKWISFVAAVLTGLVSVAVAAFEYDPLGPRSDGIAASGSALSGDAWAGFRNPALIERQTALAGGYWSQQFGLPEMNVESIALNRRLPAGSIGMTASTLGSELYRESRIDLLLAREVRSGLTLGVSLGGRFLNIRDYSSGNAVSVTAGLLAEPIEGVAIAGVWKHVNRAELSGYAGKLPESLVIGAAVEIPQAGMLIADIVSERHFPLEVRMGVESELMPNLRLRIGARTEPVRPSAGIQFDVQRWRFHYSGDRHPDLGISHSVGLGFALDAR